MKAGIPDASKRVYEPPKLHSYGDLAEMTGTIFRGMGSMDRPRRLFRKTGA